MNNLTVINHNGFNVVDSREVAEMVGKRHADLLETIRGYIDHLTNGNFRSLEFFILSSYQDEKGETRACYLLTRKGCDMVANKMTGEKGVLFTAAYVTKFEEMENALAQPKLPQSYAEALRELATTWEENQKLLPKAEAFDQFMDGSNNQKMNDVAKTLGIGRNKLFEFLRENHVLMNNNTPYQWHIDCGRFVVKQKPITMGEETINKPQTFVTPKGVEYIRRILSEKKVG